MASLLRARSCDHFWSPQEGAEKESEAPQAEARQEARKERTARVDQAGLLQRTFAVDVEHIDWARAQDRQSAESLLLTLEGVPTSPTSAGARGWRWIAGLPCGHAPGAGDVTAAHLLVECPANPWT